MNFRTIGKIGFLLVIIGFFMPWVTAKGVGILVVNQLNGFQCADFAMANGANNAILIYVWFIFAFAGLIIGILLLNKKNPPIIIDWLVTIVCIVGPLVFIKNSDDSVVIQSGLYATLIGSFFDLIFLIISAFSGEIEIQKEKVSKILKNILERETQQWSLTNKLSYIVPSGILLVGYCLYLRWIEYFLDFLRMSVWAYFDLFYTVILIFVVLFAFRSKPLTKWFALVYAISYFMNVGWNVVHIIKEAKQYDIEFLSYTFLFSIQFYLALFCSIILLAVALWNIFNDKKKKREEVQTFTTNDLAQ